MPSTTLRIRKFVLRKDQLARLSDAERDLFFLSGHILNELNSLNKVFSWCLQSESEDGGHTKSLAQGVQSMIYARILAGKLWEAWEALGKTWYSPSKLSVTLAPVLHPDSQAALSALKAYFSRSNLIKDVRRSFAFHYNARRLGDQWEAVADGDSLEIVLGGSIGNNINFAAELVTNAALLRAAHPTELDAGLQTFLHDVQTMTGHFTTFLEGVSLIFIKKMFGDQFADQGAEDEISVGQSFSAVRIPYFCAPDKR